MSVAAAGLKQAVLPLLEAPVTTLLALLAPSHRAPVLLSLLGQLCDAAVAAIERGVLRPAGTAAGAGGGEAGDDDEPPVPVEYLAALREDFEATELWFLNRLEHRGSAEAKAVRGAAEALHARLITLERNAAGPDMMERLSRTVSTVI